MVNRAIHLGMSAGGGGGGPLSVDANQYVHTSSGLTSQVTVTTTQANETIVVLFFENSTTAPTVSNISSSPSLTWNQLGSAVHVNSAGSWAGAFWAKAPTAQTYTITIDYTGLGFATFANVNAFSIVNPDTGTVTDPNASNPTGLDAGLASMTTSNAKDIIFGLAGVVSGGTIGGGWTALQNVTGDFMASMYRIESAPGTFTLNTGGTGTQLGSFIGAIKGN